MLETYQAVGLNETERRTAVSKKTILAWSRAAGLDPHVVSEEITRRNARASAAAAARRARESEELRVKMLQRLYKIRDAASIRELELLAAGGFDKSSLRDITQARRFAVHDAELLGGFPTERTENLVDGEEILELVRTALANALRAIPDTFHDALTGAFAHELRQVREQAAQLELPPADVEDADYEVEVADE